MNDIQDLRIQYRNIREQAVDVAGNNFSPESFDELVFSTIDDVGLERTPSDFVLAANMVLDDIQYREAIEAERWMLVNAERNA